MTLDDFWERVDAVGDCWIWTGDRNSDGYGQVRLQVRPRRRQGATRWLWETLHGPIGHGLQVCHHCDTA